MNLLRRTMLACLLTLHSLAAWAIAPYIAGDRVAAGSLPAVAAAVEAKLQAAGFRVLGVYTPQSLPTHAVVVATDAALLEAIRTLGGSAIVAAPIRVAITTDGVVSYTNPDYWSRAVFRHRYAQAEPAVLAVQARLAKALGAGPGFGGDVVAVDLPRYRYLIGMEHFDDDKNLLARHANFETAVQTVQANLARGVAGVSKVYELVIPEREIALFGVAMNSPANGDATLLKKLGVEDRIAGYPYEMFVQGGEVHALYARYRLALAFPDLSMAHFMRIVYAPGEIRSTLVTVAGGN